MSELLSVLNATGFSVTFKLTSALDEAGGSAYHWAYVAIGIMGIAAIVIGGYLLARKLWSGARGQQGPSTSWLLIALLIGLGGVFTFGGWAMFNGVFGAGAVDTVQSWR